MAPPDRGHPVVRVRFRRTGLSGTDTRAQADLTGPPVRAGAPCGWLGAMVPLGASDCEAIRSGLLAQPVNTLTSLAFVVAGVIVASRGPRAWTSPALGFGALLVAVGLGSVAFHGPQPVGARLLHDIPIDLLLGFVVLHRIRPRGTELMPALATLGAVSVLVVGAVPGFAVALMALLAATALLVEVRWHVRRSDPRRVRPLTGAVAAALTVGAVSLLLGRTGAPTCDPLGVVQFHGLWHVSAAAAFGLWWWQLESRAEVSEPAPVAV